MSIAAPCSGRIVAICAAKEQAVLSLAEKALFKDLQLPRQALQCGALVGLVCFDDGRRYDASFHKENAPWATGPYVFRAHAAVALATPIANVKGALCAFHPTQDIQNQVASSLEVQQWSHWPGLANCWKDGKLLAISVRQPYAAALVGGHKNAENRSNLMFECPGPVVSQSDRDQVLRQLRQQPTTGSRAPSPVVAPAPPKPLLIPLPPLILPPLKRSRLTPVVTPPPSKELHQQEQNDKEAQAQNEKEELAVLQTSIMDSLASSRNSKSSRSAAAVALSSLPPCVP